MTTLYLAWRSAPYASWHLAQAGPPVTPPCPITAPLRLAVVSGGGQALTEPQTPAEMLAMADGAALAVMADPRAQTVAAAAGLSETASVAHYLRLADASVKPLLADLAPLALEAGDAYVAVIFAPGLANGTWQEARLTAARFIHLRDYFNAHKLADALLEHLAELGPRADASDAAVLIIEAR